MKAYLNKILILLSITTSSAYAIDENIIWRTGMAASIGSILYTNVLNTTESGFETGINTDNDISMVRFNFNWKIKNIDLNDFFNLSISNTVRISKWSNINNNHDNVHAIDYAPTFRMTFRNKFIPYIEYATGISYLSSTKLKNNDFGGNFAFNHFIGVGYNIYNFNLSGKFQHYSNNNIFESNPGINFKILSLSYKY
jgi:hypothetical protein